MKRSEVNTCPERALKRATSDLRCAARKLGLGAAANAMAALYHDLAREAGVDPQAVIREARELATDELEIDDHPAVSPGEDGSGCWVAAWVWIPAEK